MHWLEGADHSFAVTDEVGEMAQRWLELAQKAEAEKPSP